MATCQSCGTTAADDARFCASCGTALGQVLDPPSVRKHVIVFFVDIVGSTSLGERLDPEVMRAYLKRYFETVSAILWRHGGTVEKFIGDAVMAVFGVPVAREDDATRALRAAADLHVAIAEISAGLEREYNRMLQVRIGINGGEVYVSRHADGQISVTGDVVNVAARLEQNAGAGETLVGGTVATLAGRTAPLVPVEPLQVKGKSTTLPAWRLDTAMSAPAVGPRVPMVGREEEIADLHRIADRVTRRNDSCLVTVLGAAGIGKSRLVSEFIAQRSDLRVFEGHCQSFASGGAFWPLAQVLEQLDEDWRQQVRDRLPNQDEATQVIDRLATAVGDVDRHTGLDDIVWAARQLIEALSQTGPIALIWEDLQWAEPTFIEFLSRLSTRTRSVPVLVVCVSRPDLLLAYPTWGGGHSCAMSLELGPLTSESLYELVDELTAAVVAHGGPDGAVATAPPDAGQLADVSEGNPLIVLQMLEFAASHQVAMTQLGAIPVGVTTLFEAQLDRLLPVDRLFCECASVMGREFWAEGVQFAIDEMTMSDADLQEILDRLIRLDVIQPTRARRTGRPGYRFTHSLLMETGYRAMPKNRRSLWHCRITEWFESAPYFGDGERSVLTAFHLERAYALSAEIHHDDPETARLAIRAAEAALAASRQCLACSDLPSAARHFEQAQRLLPVRDRRHRDVVRELFDCLVSMGAADRLTGALDAADAALTGDPVWDLMAPVPRAILALRADNLSRQDAHDAAHRVLAGLADRHEPAAMMWAHELDALAYTVDLQLSAAERSIRLGLDCARDIGDERAERRMLTGLCELAFWGPFPVEQGRALCAELLPAVESDLQLTAPLVAIMGALAALEGDQAAAVELIGRAVRIATELELTTMGTLLRQHRALILGIGGDHRAAAVEYRTAADELIELESAARMFRVLSARELVLAGDIHAARAAMHWGSTAPVPPVDPEDPYYVGVWYGVAARLSAHDGDAIRAREWASMGVAMAGTVENPRSHADALIDLAAVHRRVGDHNVAETALTAARQQLIRKGATRSLELASEWAGPEMERPS